MDLAFSDSQSSYSRQESLYQQVLKFKSKDKNDDKLSIVSGTIIGHRFIEGYSIFKKYTKTETIIFCKKIGFTSIYLFMKFLTPHKLRTDKGSQSLENSAKNNSENVLKILKDLRITISDIDEFRNSEQENYKIILGNLQDCSQTILEKTDFQNLEKYLVENNCSEDEAYKVLYQLPCNKLYEEISQQPQRDMFLFTEVQFKKLKQIINNYVDTFGTKHKGNFLADLEKNNQTNFSIKILLNTVAFLIYQQSYEKPFTQLQSSCWTNFNSRSRFPLETDRKDLVITGNGRYLILDLVFMSDLKKYLQDQDYLAEARSLIQQCKKFYSEAFIKAVQISNQLHSCKIIYKIKIQQIDGFSAFQPS